VKHNKTARWLAIGVLPLAFIAIIFAQQSTRDTQSIELSENVVVGQSEEDSQKPGKQIGRFQIPKIKLNQPLREGTNAATLKEGPGHYPKTPLPGGSGNVAIACHRTTFGAPCLRLGELQPGDLIRVSKKRVSGGDKWFDYTVTQVFVVQPSMTAVLEQMSYKDTLTITTCHPMYSSKQRLIIRAELT
jgi:sortase A